MEHNNWEYYGDLEDRDLQVRVLDAWAREISQTYGGTEEALQFWLEQMIKDNELPGWWSNIDLDYMRRRLGID